MASYQYVYHMDGVSKTYPGGKKCFENIRLNFLPGVKIGVVSKTDLLRFQHSEPEAIWVFTVGDVMTHLAFTLTESASVARAAALLSFENIEQIPVTGSGQEVIGMISSRDILSWLARRSGYVLGTS